MSDVCRRIGLTCVKNLLTDYILTYDKWNTIALRFGLKTEGNIYKWANRNAWQFLCGYIVNNLIDRFSSMSILCFVNMVGKFFLRSSLINENEWFPLRRTLSLLFMSCICFCLVRQTSPINFQLSYSVSMWICSAPV